MRISFYTIAVPVFISMGCAGCLLPFYEEDEPTECSQGQESWGLSYKGESSESIQDLATDSQNNLIAVGTYDGPMQYGGAAPTKYSGLFDSFVAKHNAEGKLQWIFPISNSQIQLATHVDVDPNGLILVGGTFEGDIQLGGNPETHTGTPDKRNVFIAEYSPDGNAVWSQVLTPEVFGLNLSNLSVGDLDLSDLRYDRLGNIIVCGTFISTGANSVTSTQMFFAKFDINRSQTQLKRFPLDSLSPMMPLPAAHIFPAAIDSDSAGNVFITGTTLGDAFQLGALAMEAAQNERLFLLKLNPEGEPVWQAPYQPADSPQKAIDLIIDHLDNKYVLGSNFGYFSPDSIIQIDTVGYEDLLIIKHDSQDLVRWAKGYGGSGEDTGSKIKLNRSGKLLVTGSTPANIVFERSLVSSGKSDIFLAFLNTSNGEPVFSTIFGDGQEQIANGLAIGKEGKPFIAGEFGGTLDFGLKPLVKSSGDTDLFIAKPCQ